MYLNFEANPDEEFDFFLADRLGKTVDEIREMSNDQWCRWLVFHQRKAQRQELAMLKAGG